MTRANKYLYISTCKDCFLIFPTKGISAVLAVGVIRLRKAGLSMTLKVLDLFAGAGGFTLAGEMAGGFETVAFCEIDKHAQKVLRKNWPGVPVFDDVTKLRGVDVGDVDLISGGFPCQDLSVTGAQEGLGDGTRSGLFREMLRLASDCGRPFILFENSPQLISGRNGDWFREFLRSLSEIGYDAEWTIVSVGMFGGPHERKRACVVAYPNEAPIERGRISQRIREKHCDINRTTCWWGNSRGPERRIYRVDDGVSLGSHRRRSGIMGNAVAPPVWAVVMEAIRETIEGKA